MLPYVIAKALSGLFLFNYQSLVLHNSNNEGWVICSIYLSSFKINWERFPIFYGSWAKGNDNFWMKWGRSLKFLKPFILSGVYFEKHPFIIQVQDKYNILGSITDLFQQLLRGLRSFADFAWNPKQRFCPYFHPGLQKESLNRRQHLWMWCGCKEKLKTCQEKRLYVSADQIFLI